MSGQIVCYVKTNEELIVEAKKAREYAYAPYSNFKVGAALMTKSGKIYSGCNIENAAYGPTNCAERTAFFKAVSEGERDFAKIAIVGGKANCAPCGVCRQVMMEFCDPHDFGIVLENEKNECVEYKLGELFPLGFGRDNL